MHAPDLTGGLVPVEDGHLAVHEDRLVATLPSPPYGLRSVGHDVDPKAEVLEHGRCHPLVNGVVLGQQDLDPDDAGSPTWSAHCGRVGHLVASGEARRLGWSRPGPRRPTWIALLVEGNGEPERAAVAQLILDADLAAHQLDELVGHGETQAGGPVGADR